MVDEKLKKYGKSKNGNFEVIDTIGIPHPYCITPKHLKGEGMYLDKARIIEAEEKYGAVCDICRGINRRTGKPILTYDEHETALLVACYIGMDDNKEELHKFLLKCKSMCEEDKYAGFAFVRKNKGGELNV